MSKNSKKNRSGSPASGSSSPAPGGASTKKAVERRPVLVLYLDKIKGGSTDILRVTTSLEPWSRQTSNTPEMNDKFDELISLGKEISPRMTEFATAFGALVELGFVPEAATSTRGPKFAPGTKVKVEAGDWMTYYTKSGLYTAEELSDLTVVKLGVKEILCKTTGGREILIRTAGHLEPFESAPPSET